MKTLFLTCFCSIALSLSLFAQRPTISPDNSPADISPAAAGVSPTASASPGDEEDLEKTIEKRIRKRLRLTIDDHDVDFDGDVSGDMGDMMAIPIVAIIFTTLFGAPVLIVGTIMLLSYMKARSLHRTVREMVAKGQPVPPELLGGPAAAAVRPKSDLRRGIVLVMVGFGIMILLGALNDWEGGAWALGVIPFLIGVGYLLVWKLEGKKDNGQPVE